MKNPREMRFFGSQLAGTPMYMSPEILSDREYSPAVDIWAAGVVLYVLLTGRLPFTGRTHAELFAQIGEGRWSMEGPEWAAVSDAAKEAVACMLVADSMRRLTAAEVLRLPFIAKREQAVPDVALPSASMNGIRLLNAKARFKAAARACILNVRHIKRDILSSGLGLAQFDTLRLMAADTARIKRELDKELGAEQQGLDRASFRRVMSKLGWRALPFDRVFDLFDSNADGVVDRKELLLGMTKLEVKDEACWKFCFELLDEDNSGSVTYAELAKLLVNYERVGKAGEADVHATTQDEAENTMPEDKALDCNPQDFELSEYVAELFAELDTDGNGEISLDEFLDGAHRRPDLMKVILGESDFKTFKAATRTPQARRSEQQAS